MNELDFRTTVRWALLRDDKTGARRYTRHVNRGGSNARADDAIPVYGKAKTHKCGGRLLMAELPAFLGTFGVCEKCGAEERRFYKAARRQEVL